MNFRSVAQLSDQILHWTHRLPHDIELVVGVPRSGLLAANLVSLYMNVPVADLDGFLEGRVLGQGWRGKQRLEARVDTEEYFLDTPRKVLVLDDSLLSGGAMRSVRERIEAAGLPHDISYGAVYVNPARLDEVDVYCEALHSPRMFEWNVMHHAGLKSACLDMDGVLCRDPTGSENDDGPRYLNFLENASPYLIPSAKVGWIVTSRLEKYRDETEAWLAKYGVQYGELIMLDHPTAETRRQMRIHSVYKADVYRSIHSSLFIESSIKQSVEIATLAQKQVLCIDTMQIVYPGTSATPRFTQDHHQPTLTDRAKKIVKKRSKNVLGRIARFAR